MPYNYQYPEWKEDDREFIKGLERDLEYYRRMVRKYSFHSTFRESFIETYENLKKLNNDMKNRFKEYYAEAYKPTP